MERSDRRRTFSIQTSPGSFANRFVDLEFVVDHHEGFIQLLEYALAPDPWNSNSNLTLCLVYHIQVVEEVLINGGSGLYLSEKVVFVLMNA